MTPTPETNDVRKAVEKVMDDYHDYYENKQIDQMLELIADAEQRGREEVRKEESWETHFQNGYKMGRKSALEELKSKKTILWNEIADEVEVVVIADIKEMLAQIGKEDE